MQNIFNDVIFTTIKEKITQILFLYLLTKFNRHILNFISNFAGDCRKKSNINTKENINKYDNFTKEGA
jgi:hypothetical protein